MREPIIINEAGAIDIFETREKAEDYIEPIDTKNSECDVHDSTGVLLEQHVRRDRGGVERVLISDPYEPKMFESQLRNLLINFLSHFDYSANKLNEMDLPRLVQESLRFKSK